MNTNGNIRSGDLVAAEVAVCGHTRAALGAYLLELRGLPDMMVEAVAYHYASRICAARSLGPVTVVQVAISLIPAARVATVPRSVTP